MKSSCPATGCRSTSSSSNQSPASPARLQDAAAGETSTTSFTAIDDCTRLRVLRIYPQLNQKTAIQFLDYLLSRLPGKVEVIQTDNGAEFQTAFHWHVLDKGIAH